MRYLLDTNVISELRKGRRANRGVQAWFAVCVDNELCTSVLVLGELRRGIENLRLRDPSGAAALEQWLARVHESFADRVLDVDAAVADRWGALNVPDPAPVVDGLLAATALEHGLVLVTRNVRDVWRTGVEVLNPFEG